MERPGTATLARRRDRIHPGCFVKYDVPDDGIGSRTFIGRIKTIQRTPSPVAAGDGNNGDHNLRHDYPRHLVIRIQRLLMADEITSYVASRLGPTAVPPSASAYCEQMGLSGSSRRRFLCLDTFDTTLLALQEIATAGSRKPSLIAAKHLPKTIAELEIEAGEIDPDILEVHRDREIVVVMSLYNDAFATFRSTHNTTGGCYGDLLGLPKSDRDRMDNRLVLCFTPHGIKFDDAVAPVLEEMRRLTTDGFAHKDPSGEDVRVFVKILGGRFDLPEALKNAEVLSHGAECCCRFCGVTKEDYAAMAAGDINALERKRSQEASVQQRANISAAAPRAQAALRRACGLTGAVPLFEKAGIALDPHRQFPVEPYHLLAGLSGDRVIPAVMAVLSLEGRAIFSRVRTANPPYRMEVEDQRLCELVAVGTTLLTDLHDPMRRPKKGQTEVTAKSMAMLPNIHLLQHLLDASQDYGTLLNCIAALDEAIHRISKQHVALTNRRDVCQSFLRHIVILQALSGAANGQGSARLKELMEAIRLEAPGCLRLVKGELEGTDDGVDGVLPTSDPWE
ncbi:hypothetical protein MVLG_06186 [Microbotryum lychnidis-dioicae p1A1 Lamole]|uniref:Uncharacterized protein n=1 Tax=Microbotryum lychnidis-dioicae (strain p1A1 Lamole / MvSl-1064) TaxID=683840 RepID=U5HGH8_USTV1|nr:hypothetical protein MVLG_06186 [Microbotryum lychnidis-dioicae p1A1 Lamole]|eukprot:KDE03314.1 hypothetical protein MVLG_06186 [Microbotryum lychnidis-dioicae p1A1 Lamole]